MENRDRLPGPLLSDERGLATVEYVIVLVTVILGLCGALLTWWEPALARLAVQFAWLSLPVP